MKKKRIWIGAVITFFLCTFLILWNEIWGKERGTSDTVKEIHLGVVLDDKILFSDGETMENNRFLDWILEDLNIRVVYDWIYSNEEFQRNINLHINCDALPDALMVNEEQYRKMLEYGQIQPVTEVYRNTASDQLKAFVESIGEEGKESVMVDKEMMAIPFPSLTASGINVMWIRQDWLDQLGLEVPQNIEDIEETAAMFVEKKMAGEGTIGILGPGIDYELAAVGKCSLGLNPVFSAFHAYPKYWTFDEKGNLIYGSVQEEAKQALQVLAQWYQKGILDEQIFSRENIQEILDTGKAGILFGPWWMAEMLKNDIIKNKSEWKAYAYPLDMEGKYFCTMPPVINQYLVIHKKCKNPESIVEIVNYVIKNQNRWLDEKKLEGISIKAYPIAGESDFPDELEYTYQALKESMEGGEPDIDFFYHKVLKQDLKNLKKMNRPPYEQFGIEDWNEDTSGEFIRLYGIINGVGAIAEQSYQPIYSLFSQQTPTMKIKWKQLEQLEEETYAKIILGEEPIEAFDTFVEVWKKSGGQTIEKEAAQLMEKAGRNPTADTAGGCLQKSYSKK